MMSNTDLSKKLMVPIMSARETGKGCDDTRERKLTSGGSKSDTKAGTERLSILKNDHNLILTLWTGGEYDDKGFMVIKQGSCFSDDDCYKILSEWTWVGNNIRKD